MELKPIVCPVCSVKLIPVSVVTRYCSARCQNRAAKRRYFKARKGRDPGALRGIVVP